MSDLIQRLTFFQNQNAGRFTHRGVTVTAEEILLALGGGPVEEAASESSTEEVGDVAEEAGDGTHVLEEDGNDVRF